MDQISYQKTGAGFLPLNGIHCVFFASFSGDDFPKCIQIIDIPHQNAWKRSDSEGPKTAADLQQRLQKFSQTTLS